MVDKAALALATHFNDVPCVLSKDTDDVIRDRLIQPNYERVRIVFQGWEGFPAACICPSGELMGIGLAVAPPPAGQHNAARQQDARLEVP